jgi:hypothetical protein
VGNGGSPTLDPAWAAGGAAPGPAPPSKNPPRRRVTRAAPGVYEPRRTPEAGEGSDHPGRGSRVTGARPQRWRGSRTRARLQAPGRGATRDHGASMNAPAALAGSVVVVVMVVGGHTLWSFRHSRSRCFRTRRRHRFCASRQCRTGHCTGGHFSVVTARGQYTRHSGGGLACVGAPRKSTRPTIAMANFTGRPQGAHWVGGPGRASGPSGRP